MDDTIKIYVGTDPFMKKAEMALLKSLEKTTSGPWEVIWMDYARGGIWSNWNIGRPRRNPYPGQGWGTDFTCFRFAIPEANGFEGRAIYLDVDMILLKDIRNLFEHPMDKPVMLPEHWDVILYDCAKFKDLDWWPKIEVMKPSGMMMNEYVKLLLKNDYVSFDLPEIWDCRDGEGYDPETTSLIHYTDMNTQPWKPYPKRFEYPPHPRPDMVELWENLYNEALEEG